MSDNYQWGGGTWGEAGWGESDDPLAHSLRTVFGSNSQAVARLVVRRIHHLSTEFSSSSRALSLGLSPGAIHRLNTTFAASTAVAPAPLTLRHSLHTMFAADVLTGQAPLTMGHRLVTTFVGSSDAIGYLSPPHRLSTTFEARSVANAIRLTLSHKLQTTFMSDAPAHAEVIATVPIMEPPEVSDPLNPDSILHGVVNLIRNPSAEVSLEGWEAYGGATITDDPTHAWDGSHAALVTMPTLIENQGVSIRTAMALRIMPWGGSVLWGQVYLATEDAPVVVAVWMRAHYTDGTTVDDPEVTGATITATGADAEDWQLIVTPPFDLDDTKRLNYAALMVQMVFAASAPVTLLVDGVSIELDEMMWGPSGVVIATVVPVVEEAA